MTNKNRISLYTPKLEDLWFRQRFMADPETMSYNNAWGGTIPFPESEWADWYDDWVLHPEGKCFYRYVTLDRSRVFIGEVAYHHDEDEDLWLADVIIDARYRGHGFGKAALKLLCKAARENGISILRDNIAIDNPAIPMFLHCGFTEEYRTDQIIMLKKDVRDGFD